MSRMTGSSVTYQTNDRSWLIGEATGVVGPQLGRTSGVINFALFTKASHYANGYIPCGTLVGKVTSGGKLGPYDDTASDGRQTCVGLLFNDTVVPSDTAVTDNVAIIDSFATISQAKLPIANATSGGGFVDANGRADLPLLKWRA
jgi:hypothetical protein